MMDDAMSDKRSMLADEKLFPATTGGNYIKFIIANEERKISNLVGNFV